MPKEINTSHDVNVNVLLDILKSKLYNRFDFSNTIYTEWDKNIRTVNYSISAIKETNVTERQEIIVMNKNSYHINYKQIYDNLPFETTLYINIEKNGSKTLMNIDYNLSFTKKCHTKFIYNKWIESNISSIYDRFNKEILESI